MEADLFTELAQGSLHDIGESWMEPFLQKQSPQQHHGWFSLEKPLPQGREAECLTPALQACPRIRPRTAISADLSSQTS